MPSLSAWIDIPSLATGRTDLIGYGELPGARIAGEGQQADVAILAPDRLALYPGPANAEAQWRCVTTPLRRAGPGGFLLGVRWEPAALCEVTVDGRLAASSDLSRDIPVLPIGGAAPPDHSADRAARGEAARKTRRRDFNASDLCFDAARRDALLARLADLADALRRARDRPAGVLAELIGKGPGRAMLQRAAGVANAALPVFGAFGAPRVALALPTLEVETGVVPPGLSPARDAAHPTAIDLDDWLSERAWIVDGALHDNAALLAALSGEGPLRQRVLDLPAPRRAVLDRWAESVAATVAALAGSRLPAEWPA